MNDGCVVRHTEWRRNEVVIDQALAKSYSRPIQSIIFNIKGKRKLFPN